MCAICRIKLSLAKDSSRTNNKQHLNDHTVDAVSKLKQLLQLG